MFIGRKKELKKLNEMYSTNSFEFAVIYGRRRVGKTTLIKEFCKDKKAVYFIAREANDIINIENFSKDLFNVTSPETAGTAKFVNWENAFEYVYSIAKNERIILVIDEYPYLAQANRSISSILQAHIDMKFKDSKLFLILCGSSMSFMEYQVLGYKSPLYGRRTAQFKIKPFTFFESVKYHKEFTNEEKAIIYGITSGIPEYLSKIKDGKSLKNNIVDMFLNENGHLYEEPASLLKQELREPSIYNSIITAIAKGASRLNEISTKCGMESNKCAKYLTSLITLGIVRKDKPVNDENGRKSIYVIEDNMFKFWYKFVPDNMTHIVSGNPDILYKKVIEPQMSNYMGAIFEEICIQYLMIENYKDTLPIMFGQIGRWWGGNPTLKKQEEIDIMAIDNNESVIFGECKWTKDYVDVSILDNLIRRGDLFKYTNKYYYIFSKNGFNDNCIKKASGNKNVVLVEFKDMME
ncbi:UNVERIFIED_CONTAM: hypothetical protein Cloal_4052 [Acetivibrio alkalicellulosi]